MDDFFIIAVDIGGTSFRVALADATAKIINRHTASTSPGEGFESGIRRISEKIRQTASPVPFDKVKGIAVATAGPLNPQQGIILTPPSLTSWHNVPLKDSLEREFRVPVWVESDADMAALGEQRFGAGRGCDRLIYITVSTGIGGGVILDGEVLRGKDLSIAEIGHMVMATDGPRCNCGGRGHLEALASGTAIARIAGERLSRGEASQLARIRAGDHDRLTGEMVIEAARKGDPLAEEVVGSAGNYLGMAVASLMHLFDPEMVIIGGGISNAGELILKPVRDALDLYTMADFKGRTRIVTAELGDNSGIMGAVALGLDKLVQTS